MIILLFLLWLGLKLSMPPLYFIILGVALIWKLLGD